MCLTSYKRLVNKRLNFLKTSEMPQREAQELEHLLMLPHPERESQFVSWSTKHISQLHKIKMLRGELN